MSRTVWYLQRLKQFVSLGLKNAGYEYVNIDVRLLGYLVSVWQFTHFHARIAGQCKLEIRLPTRSILTQRNSLTALMDLQTRVHKLGLKIGIYRCSIPNATSKYYVRIAYLGCVTFALPSDAGTQHLCWLPRFTRQRKHRCSDICRLGNRLYV
jgi:hypothetical protein